MFRNHEFDKDDRCMHCCCTRASIIINKWDCNPIESTEITGERTEKQWDYSSLVKFLKDVPAIGEDIESYAHMDGNWYVVFKIDLNNKYAWNVVQIIGSIINSMHDCGNFKPISPAVDLNGGPHENLRWILESINLDFTPEMSYISLHNNMPQPVTNLRKWDWD